MSLPTLAASKWQFLRNLVLLFPTVEKTKSQKKRPGIQYINSQSWVYTRLTTSISSLRLGRSVHIGKRIFAVKTVSQICLPALSWVCLFLWSSTTAARWRSPPPWTFSGSSRPRRSWRTWTRQGVIPISSCKTFFHCMWPNTSSNKIDKLR